MLEKPELQDEIIIACLRDGYGLTNAKITFLPLGADENTAVYRAVADNELSYFVKLRRGAFNDITVTLPKFLNEQGISQVIAPLPTLTGQLWAHLESFTLILYPFIQGHNGYETELSDRHWIEFGSAVKSIHTAKLPSTLLSSILQETYSPRWRDSVRRLTERIVTDNLPDSVATKTAAFLNAKRHEVLDLVNRAETLAERLQAGSPELVVCHSDMHAGNILIDESGQLYIVDWDNPILATKERDLMFSGGGQFGSRRAPHEEDVLFYQGYGQTQIVQNALAYYRYERIIDDIAVYCEQLLLTNEGGEDREQAFRYLTSNFEPNGTIEIAYNADKSPRNTFFTN